MSDTLKAAALEYHENSIPGKISVTTTKPMATAEDLSLAYSPGVAYPCLEIEAKPETASKYTARQNLVGVITNGTAVLGLGSIGALASKPVMEGKGCLFKQFSGIDVFDIEIDELNPAKFVDIVASLEPTFGGINLEDIKAPDCFYIEQELQKRVNIPVFHDDQHGTAIICAAAISNGAFLVKKEFSDIKLVCSGAGAAAIACLNLLVNMGVRKENIIVCDSKGVISDVRDDLNNQKRAFASATSAKNLAEALENADVFLGCSGPGALKPEMLKGMADKPIILALANPEPEIRPELARDIRPDCIIATGRSDYPNQVNNVLCFPYIFRGALDVGATSITEEMKICCVKALADMARLGAHHDEIKEAYGQTFEFGPDYIIPKPFDPRLCAEISSRVAQAAIDSGVATKDNFNVEEYKKRLTEK